MMRSSAIVLVLAILPCASSKKFLGASREVDPAYINLVIQGTLEGVFGSGHNVDTERLAGIKATIAPLFDVLPKNEHGLLNAPSMRYMVRRYFSQRHGWIIKGFEPYETSNVSDAQGARIIHDKVPGYVEAVMEKVLSHGGFALQDMVVVIASIEVLIFDETLKDVETAYQLNSLPITHAMPESSPDLVELLTSYFIVEHLDGSPDVADHRHDKEDIHQFYPHWADTLKLLTDIVGDDSFERRQLTNPFAEKKFSFEDVTRIAQTVTEKFGPYSNHECHDQKIKLANMDVHGTGRVKLADFYRISKEGAWQFLETQEYLTSIGALDRSSAELGPQVIIANYITGANNCISSALYYDICCLNECDGIYQHLESRIKAPTASAAKITQAIEEGITLSSVLSSTAPTEARNLSMPLRKKLEAIAAYHHDMIPLHGRLFAQWLHYAFPRECPFPHVSGAKHETVAHLKARDAQLSVTDEEMDLHIESEAGRSSPSPLAGENMWSLHEELLAPSQVGRSRGFLRTSMHIIGLMAIAALALKEGSRAVGIWEKYKKGEVWTVSKEIAYDI